MSDEQATREDTLDYGPLAGLIGVWEGDQGTDVAPGMPDRLGVDTAAFRDRWTFEPAGKAQNHDQVLACLSCSTTAWRLSTGEAFHDQTGYWLWDATDKQVLCTFVVPRGISIQAGGTVEPGARQFDLVAEVGSETYGIGQNPFLHKNFKLVRYVLKVTLNDDNSFDYAQDTQMLINGSSELFHHTDVNHLTRLP